ncbi:helix-turn-helix transcriptional regulator [Hoeflea alexandrii]|uniref:helix-turn-helix transcriptional regulator n=1 Tax=Hoeflea alexandrii TaxID=288436 RepID=UPI0022AE808B|nr:helix-turn-helix transcriptional regulator [Hoeflea alexandrii]MCZ4291091.1 helix-turn-helix transcriptional regulator [Hoeflea alexandrii]
MLSDLPNADEIYALWDDLADFDAGDIWASRSFLLRTLCDLIDAQNADWIGCVRLGSSQSRDPMKGWRPLTSFTLVPGRNTSEAIDEAFAEMEKGEPDITTTRNVELAGRFRVLLLNELATPEWFEGPSYQRYYRALDRKDSIWAGIPINQDAEIQIGFHRSFSKPDFSVQELRFVSHALRGLRWFFRHQMLGEGAGVASSPLTATEQAVLQGLLLGLSEKQIAAQNTQSPHTTHDHVKRIFRKYGVSSRSSLMALWLGKELKTNNNP